MARTKISEFSATPGNNTDIDGINIAEGCAPSGINDAIRELMSQLKDFQAGTAGDSFNGPVGTTTAAAGAFTTLSASSTVSGTGFSNYLASPPAIGGTAAAAGSFTTLSASSTVTLSGGTANGVLYLNASKVATSGSALTFDGTTLNNTGAASAIRASYTGGTYYASLNADGVYATATDLYLVAKAGYNAIFYANNAEQARLTSTGLGIGTSSPTSKLSIGGGLDFKSYIAHADNFALYANSTDGTTLAAYTGYPITFRIANSEKMRLDTSGNLGLGVTPSGWDTSVFRTFQLGTGAGSASLSGRTDGANNLALGVNFYYGSGAYKYIATGTATYYNQQNGVHSWYTAPSGTAGTAISFTQAMTLDANGLLQVGLTNNVGGGRVDALGNGVSAYVARSTSTTGSSGGTSVVSLRTVDSSASYWANAQYDAWQHIFRVSGSTEAARIDSSGNLLVGTTTPSANVKITSAGGLALAGRGSTFALVYPDWSVYNSTSGNALVFDNGSERARIDSSGNLLVGTTTQSGKVTISYAYPQTGIALTTDSTSTQSALSFSNPNGTVGTINTSGSATSYNTSSDYRLKDNPQPLTGSGVFIDALQPKTWNWKADGSKGVGFIAHEVQEVSPSSVVGEKDGEQMQAMEYGSAEFIANIIAELQSLRKRVAQLEKGN